MSSLCSRLTLRHGRFGAPGLYAKVKCASLGQSQLLRWDEGIARRLPDSALKRRALRQNSSVPPNMSTNSDVKTILLIRHGEGWHNIGYESYEDPHLTADGWAQTESLKEHLASLENPPKIEVVFVSPLIRTLETACGVLGTATRENGEEPNLMLPTEEIQEQRVRHSGIDNAQGLNFIAREECRERVGPNPCDRRQSLQETKKSFPGIDFSAIQSDNDVFWDDVHLKPAGNGVYSVGESEEEICQRGLNFLESLLQRPEKVIAVVAHAGFLHHTLENFSAKNEHSFYLNCQFKNCELRGILWDGSDVKPIEEYNFRGDWALL